MSYLGGADLSWQADYAQLYVVDADHPDFNPPIDITREMEQRRWHQMETGLVVYTDGALNQVIEVRLFSAEPKADPIEYRSGMAWQQTQVAQARFLSSDFTLSSPSRANTEGYGPRFRLVSRNVTVRIQWYEHTRPVYTVEGLPDVIRLDIWPG